MRAKPVSGGAEANPAATSDARPRKRDRIWAAVQRWVSPAAPVEPNGTPFVCFGEGASVEVDAGTTILRAATSQGVEIDHFCGGKATCGTCRVEVRAGAAQLDPPGPKERLTLGPARAAAGDRLACQAAIRGPVRINVPSRF